MKSTVIEFVRDNISTANTQTGDNPLWIFILMFMLLSAAIMLVCYIQKHNKQVRIIAHDGLLVVKYKKTLVVLISIISSIIFMFCCLTFAHAQDNELISFEVPDKITATFNDDNVQWTDGYLKNTTNYDIKLKKIEIQKLSSEECNFNLSISTNDQNLFNAPLQNTSKDLNLTIASGQTIPLKYYTDADIYSAKEFFNTQVCKVIFYCDGAPVPTFSNGEAQAIFPFTSGLVEYNNNAESQIIRYFVWVETNVDTDKDGKNDLVRVFVQVPRSAFEGNYEAASIFEARPYIAGLCNFDYDYTLDVSGNIVNNHWYYQSHYDDDWYLEDLEWYNYFLARGFAVVSCAGIGTLGSEGFESIATREEIDQYASVIKWLHGNGVAYTDKTRTQQISADWSNQKVGMTGTSYAGATQYGLALQGVEGLETVVPVDGISSWYNYTYNQGTMLNPGPYNIKLQSNCFSRRLDASDWPNIRDKAQEHMKKTMDDEIASEGNYDNYWEQGEYVKNCNFTDIPMLLVHGLNDHNVSTFHMQYIYDVYQKHNGNIKLILHQNAHRNPAYAKGKTEIYIGNQLYDNILNKWFSHYLYGVDNDIQNMANVTLQDNITGKFKELPSWKSNNIKSLNLDSGQLTSKNFVKNYWDKWDDKPWHQKTNENIICSNIDVESEFTIQGSPEVELDIKLEDVPASTENLTLSAYLCDESDNPFNAYEVDPSEDVLPTKLLQKDGAVQVPGYSSYDIVEFEQTPITSKIIGMGNIDLANPNAGFEPSTAIKFDKGIKSGDNYTYKIYLNPNYYRLIPGHKLKLYLFTYDLSNYSDESYDEYKHKFPDYKISVESAKLNIPIAQ